MATTNLFAGLVSNIPKNPFAYDLGVKIIPSKKTHDVVTICCHGYGHSNQLVNVMHSYKAPLGTLIGFNFPDHDITSADDHANISYGTINEILPLLYLLNYYVCDLKIPAINLYGFSAGGGAIVNALACLVNHKYDAQLKTVGIKPEHKKRIIHALHKGFIILDCPLKSLEEIVAFRGKSPEMNSLAANFAKNNLEPINSLKTLMGIDFTIIVYFENPDLVLSNRDDQLFVDRLTAANKGKTVYLTGSYGGHTSYHAKLWDYVRILSK